MNKLLLLFFIFTTFASTLVKAEDVPIIAAPHYTRENHSLVLTQGEIDSLKKWSADVNSDLNNALSNASELNADDKLTYLKNEIQSIVKLHREHANIFVRYSLNRSLKLVEIIEREDQSLENSILDVKIRLLTQSLKIAREYTEFDFTKFKQAGFTTYSRFGLDYFALVTELAKSIFDASAQYEMYKISLEYLQWDLYRENDNTQYATTIVKINDFLNKQIPKTSTDKIFIEQIKKIKKLITELDIRHYKGAIEFNEIITLIKGIVEKNKKINMSLPYQKGDQAIIWDYASDMSLSGNIVTITKVRELASDLLIYSIYDSKTRKRLSSVLDSNLYKMEGCMPNTELCVGVPVMYFDEPITIVAIGIYNRLIARDKDGELHIISYDLFFRRAGCLKKIKICVGDMIRDPGTNKLIYVTGIREDSDGSILAGDSIYDEKFNFVETSNKDKF